MPVILSHEEIKAICQQGEAAVPIFEILIYKINELEQEVARLKAQLSKDSHNSSKPPSSDFNKPAPKSLRKKSGKKSGGQNGHKGFTLNQVENPDKKIKHRLKGRCSCGRSLSMAELIDYIKRQVFDLPPIKIEVTEHLAEIKKCACGRVHTAEFPEGVEAPTQYGKRVRAIMLYLSVFQLVPQQRTTEAMNDLFGVCVSEGTLNTILKRAHFRLEGTIKAIKAAIRGSPVIHCDETGMYVSGKRLWEHTCGTERFTYYYCHRGRGIEAIKDGGIVPGYQGRVIHDAWPSYFNFDVLNGLCNAHNLRELIFVKEVFKQRWVQKMIDHICYIKKVVDQAKAHGRNGLSQSSLKKYREKYDRIISNGFRVNPEPEYHEKKRGRKKQSPAKNLLDRLYKYADEIVAFMYDFRVPFDNNLSERDLRMTKVKQKISGCFRSMEGAHAFCRIRSYISTIRKQGHNVFEHLVMCFDPIVKNQVLLPE